jgi:FMN phosphatase YigB (HAD superfamily)
LGAGLSIPKGVIWDLGNVLIDWQPHAAVAAGMGEDEARRFLGADDFDFMAFNQVLDGGGTWEEGEAELRRTHPHWVEPTSRRRWSARSRGPSTSSGSCTTPASPCSG